MVYMVLYTWKKGEQRMNLEEKIKFYEEQEKAYREEGYKTWFEFKASGRMFGDNIPLANVGLDTIGEVVKYINDLEEYCNSHGIDFNRENVYFFMKVAKGEFPNFEFYKEIRA